LGFCGHQMVNNSSNGLTLAVGAFSPFTVMTVLIDPYTFASRIFAGGDYNADPGEARIILFIASWAAVGTYTLIVWSMYKSMVKNFDMTIRRQSR
jgi:hypothetical protein